MIHNQIFLEIDEKSVDRWSHEETQAASLYVEELVYKSEDHQKTVQNPVGRIYVISGLQHTVERQTMDRRN